VSEIFSCIQGEGCNTGIPMVLVRLSGCNLRCPWCDTDYAWKSLEAMTMSIVDVVAQVIQYRSSKWVLLTGGEPTMQPLQPLTQALHSAGYKIALETNGIIPISGSFDWICVSPKLEVEGGNKIAAVNLALADELKFVVADKASMAAIDAFMLSPERHQRLQHREKLQICLQPISQDAIATGLCVYECKRRGWRLSLQTHKFIDQP